MSELSPEAVREVHGFDEEDVPEQPPWDGVGYRELPPSGEKGAQTAFQDDIIEKEN